MFGGGQRKPGGQGERKEGIVRREGRKERERDAVEHDAGEPREGRPASAFEDTQVLSPIVFRCVVFCMLPAPSLRRLRSTPTTRTFLYVYRNCLCPVGYAGPSETSLILV